jgi:hypothetical protein
MLLMLGALLLIVLRRPGLFIHGQIFAEEGTAYLQFAWCAGWWQTLLTPHLGYFSLWDNLCSLIAARFIPLREVAVVLPVCAAAVQLLTVYLAISCEPVERYRAVAGLVCLIAPPADEVWCNTINSQFYLAIATGLILISSPARLRILRCATLLLAGLSGPVSCCLAPFFILRAALRKTRVLILQAFLITACAVVQAAVILAALEHHTRSVPLHERLELLGPEIFLKTFVTGFGSRVSLHVLLALIHPGPVAFTILWLLCIPCLVAACYVARSTDATAGWLVALGLWSITFNLFGALGSATDLMRGADRYFFTGNAFLLLAFIHCAFRTRRRLAIAAASLILLSSVADYFIYTVMHPKEPDWRAQVADWQRDESTPLVIAPANWGPPLHLSHNHSCGPLAGADK